ncbi:MAG: NADH-quinone oxidoreductase subunit M [Verrucomicrobiae bacterium]|nr:NADH-quinone oxidoreductase subunit M [Verrucomicrobiae bacterium]
MSTLELLVFLPLLAALAVGLGAPARFTALGASVLVLLISFYCALNFSTVLEGNGSWQFASSRTLLEMPGFPKLSLAFGLDGISLVLVLLSALVLVAAVWVAPVESAIKGSSRLYYVSLLLIGGGALGAFTATDLFFLYAFHELALIPTFLMIGIFGHGEQRVRTAWTITIFLGVGSLILLVGLILAVGALDSTSFDVATLTALAKSTPIAANLQGWIFLLLFIGFGILVSLFPFHSWAAPAYAEAPTPVAMLHAGVLKKFGLYGLIRLALPLAPAGAEKWLHLVLILLLGNILYIGLVTIAQKKLDRMLGYSSVMHMGYAFLGIAAGNVVGVSGAVLLMFAHGLSIALLFGLAGWMRDRFGGLEFDKLGGIAKSLPKLGLLFGFAAFASVGLPGFANFAAEVEVFFGAFAGEDAGMSWIRWATVGALWGVVISAVYMLRAYRTIFMGPKPEKLETPSDLDWGARVPLLILLVALLAVGFAPDLLNQFIRPAVNGLFLVTAQ